jgi:KipI family sensor histidine kinase inhibitor
VTVRAASDRSLLVSFGETISPDAQRSVARLTHALGGVRGILNLHPAFVSLLIDFDPRLRTHAEIEALVHERVKTATERGDAPARRIEIPVQYDGPDLEDVAKHANLTVAQAVELHSSAEYEVAFVGFSTCFPYLSGLPPALAMPRLKAPRKHVAAGSIAIGGAQAGVYPLASPGGWRLIGRTELRLFDPDGEPPALLRMGDGVRFVPAMEERR